MPAGTMHRDGNAAEPVPGDVSSLLRAWSDGDQRALGLLTPIVHGELHRLAHHYMRRERAGHSLQTTALVNEAYLRLVDYKRMQLAEPRPFPGGHRRRRCAESSSTMRVAAT